MNSKTTILAGCLLTFCAISYLGHADTLNFDQCKTYYVLGNNSTYVPVDVCGPGFPRLNANVILTSDNPVRIFPDYNFSVKIDESMFANLANANSDKVRELNDTLTNFMKTDFAKKSDIDTAYNALLERIGQISQNASAINSFDTRLTNLERGNSKSGDSTGTIIVIVLVIVTIAGYAFVKLGVVKLPKTKVSREEYPQEYEGAKRQEKTELENFKSDIVTSVEKILAQNKPAPSRRPAKKRRR